MFLHLVGHSSLGIIPDQVVAVIESINAPNIGTPLGTEKTKAYIVGLRLPSGNFTVAIYLHLLDSNRSVIYASDPLEVLLDGYSELEAEAIHFGESMGFMLDNMNFRARPPDDIARLIQMLPFFYEIPPHHPGYGSIEQAIETAPSRIIPGEDPVVVTPPPQAPAPPPAPPRTQSQVARPTLSPDETAALARLLSSF